AAPNRHEPRPDLLPALVQPFGCVLSLLAGHSAYSWDINITLCLSPMRRTARPWHRPARTRRCACGTPPPARKSTRSRDMELASVLKMRFLYITNDVVCPDRGFLQRGHPCAIAMKFRSDSGSAAAPISLTGHI